MTKTATIAPVTFASLVSFAGKTGAARQAAFNRIPDLAGHDATSRAVLVETIKAVRPDDRNVTAIKTAVMAGRVAAKLGCSNDKALSLICQYVAPVAANAKAKPLPAGKIGRRSEVEHRAIRSAEQAWSMIAADAEIGMAKKSTEQQKAKREKAKRAAHHNDVASQDGAAPKAAAPDHAQLVTPPAKMTPNEACDYIATQAATLLAFCNKYAKSLPTDYGMAVHAFKGAINKAQNDRATREAIAQANK